MPDPISILVSPIVKRCIEEAVNFSKEKYASIAGVKNECQNLGEKLEAIQAVLKDAEDRQEQLIDEADKNWLGRLRNAACDVEDIVDDFRTEACLWKMKEKLQQVYFCVGRIKIKSEAANEIKSIMGRLERISQDRRNYRIDRSSQVRRDYPIDGHPPPVTEDVDSSILPDHIVGREEDKAKIIEMLLDVPMIEGTATKELSVIPIIGMGGIGKSTLCRLVMQDDSVKSHFDGLTIWVRVSEVFDRKRIFTEIERECQSKGKSQIDVNLLPLNQIEVSIQNFLAGRRFLIVLDDVWTENYQDWESLRRVLSGGAGSKVLITSRSSRVAQVIGTKEPYILKCLRDEECRLLFQNVAYRGHNLPSPDVRDDMEREIVKMCNGLPLAIKAMGVRLKGPEVERKWKKICKYGIWEIEKQPADRDNLQVLPKLRRSYRYLQSHLKQCFAYCSSFPKGYVFDKKELVKLWMAEGFIVNDDKMGRPQDSGIEYFDELLANSFFQPVNIDDREKYKMHNLIHDLALYLSSPYCFQVKGNETDIPENSRHLSLLCDKIEDSIIKVIESSSSKKLRTFLLHTESSENFGAALERMLQSMRYMRVLDLSSGTLRVIPESIQKMKLLRYLNLSKTGIKELPDSVCTLYNLQTLVLLGCKELSKLPDKLHDLVNLQHLDLDDEFWDDISDVPPKIGDITNLQYLRKFIVGKKQGHGIEELKNMSYLSGTLHIVKLENAAKANEAGLDKKDRLEKLILEWKDKDRKAKDEAVHEKTLDDLKSHENLKELHILYYRGSKFPDWLTEKNLKVVCLKHCDNCKVLRLGPLRCLQELNIQGMQNLEEWREDECPQLTQLRISSCHKLHSLPNIFTKLTGMEIIKCDSLGALPSTPSLKHLTLDDTSRREDWKEKNYATADSCHIELKESDGVGLNVTLSAPETRSTAAPWYSRCVCSRGD